jgi:outer membrane protein assembly factor BamB
MGRASSLTGLKTGDRKMSFRFGSTLMPVLVLAGLAACGRPAPAEDWPCWRGPHGDGISRETGLLREWPRGGPRQLWRVPLSGGFSSVVVAGGRVWTQTKEKNQEVVLCLDAGTGKEVWRYRYDCDYGAYPTFTGGGMPSSRTGPRATPTVDGDRVYTLGATGVLLCLQARTGRVVWRQDLTRVADCDVPRHGYGASPLVAGGRVYVYAGGTKGKSLAALDKKDGHVLWQSLDDPIGHATPVWARVGGAGQVIFFTGAGAVGVAPADGKLLWRYPWKTRHDLNIATPIFAGGKVFISSNYGSGGAVFRLRDRGEPETVWKATTMHNHFSSSVLSKGHLYGFSEARLRCVDFQTGKVRWDQAGLGRGSLVLADGNLIVLGDHGQLVLARANPSAYTELSRCQLFTRETLTWTVPVVSGGRLFVRCENALLALDLTGKGK